MSDPVELREFWMKMFDLEDRLKAAQGVRLAGKADGSWNPQSDAGKELEAASLAINDFRAYWREVGAWVKATEQASVTVETPDEKKAETP